MEDAKTFMLNSHGFEVIHKNPIKLNTNERIIMFCDTGCTLFVYKLLNDFIYKHLSRVKNSSEFINLLHNPIIAGNKYDKLKKVLNNKFCVFQDEIPYLKFDFRDVDFRSGLMQLPVIMEGRFNGEKLKDPYTHINFESYTFRPRYVERYKSNIEIILKKMREQSKGNGFYLILFTCREHVSELKDPETVKNYDMTDDSSYESDSYDSQDSL